MVSFPVTSSLTGSPLAIAVPLVHVPIWSWYLLYLSIQSVLANSVPHFDMLFVENPQGPVNQKMSTLPCQHILTTLSCKYKLHYQYECDGH